jgi:hypothetical protein
VPFIPSHPIEILKSGDMYLKSIDRNHRRDYEKFLGNNNSERHNDDDDDKNVQQLYVRNKYIFI